MSQDKAHAPVEFYDQLRADQTTLQTMIEDQLEQGKLLTREAGDPLGLKELRPQMAGQHDTYIQALEHALDVLNSLIPPDDLPDIDA